MVMLVGGFVYVSMALSTEGAKKGMIYYIARMQYNCVHDFYTSVSPVYPGHISFMQPPVL